MTRRPGRLPHDLVDEAGLRRWRNQPLEREPDVHRARAQWRALVAIVIAMAPGGAYLMEQNECLELSYAVGEIRAEQRQLAEQERRLTARRAGLESLQSIERWARDNGLRRPEREHVVVLQEPVPAADPVSESIAVARAPGRAVTGLTRAD